MIFLHERVDKNCRTKPLQEKSIILLLPLKIPFYKYMANSIRFYMWFVDKKAA